LNDEDSQRNNKAAQPSVQPAKPSSPPAPQRRNRQHGIVRSESEEEADSADARLVSENGGTSLTRASARSVSQSQRDIRSQESGMRSTRQSQTKRAAPEPAQPQPAKRQRPARRIAEVADSDDSDDELKFRFGKRR
jgi:hypothetical protein